MQNMPFHVVHRGAVHHGTHELQNLPRWVCLQWGLCPCFLWGRHVRGRRCGQVHGLRRQNQVQHGWRRDLRYMPQGLIHNGRFFHVDADGM